MKSSLGDFINKDFGQPHVVIPGFTEKTNMTFSSHETCLEDRSYLQFPDALALPGHPLHGGTHQGDEHVEQQDVGEHDVADEQDVEHLDVLHVVRELQVSHADGELEQLQCREADVVVRRFSAHERPGTALRVIGGVLLYEGHHRCWDNKAFIFFDQMLFSR